MNINREEIIRKYEYFISNPDVMDAINDIKRWTWKSHRLLVLCFCIMMEPAYLPTLRAVSNARSLAVVILSTIFMALSYFILTKSIEMVTINSKPKYYIIIILLLIYRTGFNVILWHGSVYLFGIAIILYIFMHQKNIIYIPIVCASINILTDGFVNDYLITFLVIYLILKYKEVDNVKLERQDTIAIIISALAYFIFAIVDWWGWSKLVKSDCMVWQYYCDYEHFGFVARGLIASVRDLILGSPGTIEGTHIFILCLRMVSTLLMLAVLLVIWLCGNRQDNVKHWLILAILCSEPFRRLWYLETYIYFDCILISLALICIMLIIYNKWIYLIAPILAVGMCIHHGMAIFIYPLIFFAILYRYIVSEGLEERKFFLLGILSSAIVAGLFVYFHFYANANNTIAYMDACEYVANCVGREWPVDANIFKEDYLYINIDYVLYNGKISNYGVQEFSLIGIINSLFLWIIMLPIQIIIVKSLKVKELIQGSATKRVICSIAPYSTLIILASYLEVDYGRWNSFLIFTLMIELLLIQCINYEKNIPALFNEKNRDKICFAILILMMLLPDMGAYSCFAFVGY